MAKQARSTGLMRSAKSGKSFTSVTLKPNRPSTHVMHVGSANLSTGLHLVSSGVRSTSTRMTLSRANALFEAGLRSASTDHDASEAPTNVKVARRHIA